ncbi:MAG TPA: amino acid adenylation domain-containing protein [Pirellulales bacterium]|nr:amino acid adenylation domain-containing protein [Pirellulales bacterium]
MIGPAGTIHRAARALRPPRHRRGFPPAHEAFELQAAATPGATAVVYGNRSLSYAQLDQRANALAGVLAELGVGPECLVGVALERSLDMVVSLLAVLKAGGAFLPFDPGYPRRRLEFMLADARPQWCVTHQALLDSLPSPRGSVGWRHRDGLMIVGQCAAARRPATSDGRRLAYAIYTSGSSGQPKAALLTHGGLANLIAAERGLLRLRPGRRVLQFASLAFDAAVWEIFGTLTSGASLVLADAAELLPGEQLRRTIDEHRIDTLTLPPSVLSMLGPPDLPSLTTLVVAGEACGAALASQWSVGRRLINAYGPTEATVCATACECPRGDQPAPPLGDPLPGVELLVLDRQLRPVAKGDAGELCIAGPGLARGYLNRPELTAEKFIQHPLVRRRDGRLYRTGDLVRRRADGQLEFLGRTDRQIKIRGVRIELDEITAALEAHPKVLAAATVAAHDRPAARLACFAVPRAGAALAANELRAWLHARLPVALVPSSLTLVDRWPLSPNGKLDEPALLALEATKIATPSAPPTRSAFDGQVRDLFQELLHTPEVGRNDDFFQLGGDSLRAAELLIRIERRFGRRVSLGQLLANSNVGALARLLASETRHEAPSTAVPLETGGQRPPLFLVHPAGGSVVCYRRLAQTLGHGQPCYGLESPALVGDERPLTTIEAMAERYLDDVLRIQPDGPYLLAGWSLGGLVAYQMAHRLREADRPVPLLVLIDAGVLLSFQLLRRFVSTDDVPAFMWKHADRQRMHARLCRHEGRRLLPTASDEKLSRRIFDTFWANVEAAYHYSPPDDGGPLTLVVGADAQGKYHPFREWRQRCQTICLHELPFEHLDLLEPPCVGQVAGIFRSAVDEAILQPETIP